MALLLNANDSVNRSYTITKPSPNHPLDVNGVGVRTENLFPSVESKLHVGRIESNGTIGYQVGTITIDDNSITYQADTAWRGFYTDYIQTADNVTLTLAPNVGNSVSWSCSCYNTNNEFLGRATYTYSSSAVFFTLRGGTTKVRIAVTGENNQYTIRKPMLNTGSTAKPYEPYGYKIPISSAGQTNNIYLGEVQTTRKIKKRVFRGLNSDGWYYNSSSGEYDTYRTNATSDKLSNNNKVLCTHFPNYGSGERIEAYEKSLYIYVKHSEIGSLTQFNQFLQQQYSAGTPVTVWYVLGEPTTGIVNEPLMKIGDYADTVSNATSILTTEGANSITVDTTVQPSEFTATWTGWHNANVKEWDGSHWNE